VSVIAVIVAGGSGERFGAMQGKQLARACGRPVLSWSVDAFRACPAVDAIVVVGHPDRLAEYETAVGGPKLVAVVAGGETRQDSVAAGLARLPLDAELVAVHDGARPLVTSAVIAEAVDSLRADPSLAGVVVGHPVFDTLKRVGDGRGIAETVDREGLWAAQTPQVFRADRLREAYAKATAEGFLGTDDASLVERIGGTVVMVRGPRDNIKVTVPEDLVVVEAVLRARKGSGV
jgi:2-C-methyl-D-erythritol 4-phosphate cytidylyltransferase